MTAKRQCFWVDPNQTNPRGFIPSLVTEGEPGHHPMVGSGELAEPWFWGTDLETAQGIARQCNRRDFGLSDGDVKEIIDSSILASIRTDAAEAEARKRWES